MGDDQLVERTLAGDNEAFETLIRHWSPRLLAYARGLVPQSVVAEDIAQESLLRAYRHLATLQQPNQFGPWLLSIAHRLILDWRKAKARSEVAWLDSDTREIQSTSTDDRNFQNPQLTCEKNELQRILYEQIDGLPDELRQVLLMRYFDDLSYDELAGLLGVSKATVNARLAKARTLLRVRMTGVRSER